MCGLPPTVCGFVLARHCVVLGDVLIGERFWISRDDVLLLLTFIDYFHW